MGAREAATTAKPLTIVSRERREGLGGHERVELKDYVLRWSAYGHFDAMSLASMTCHLMLLNCQRDWLSTRYFRHSRGGDL